MPKGLNLKGFGRRKSSGNALDFDQPERDGAPPSAQSSSFRVLERPEKKSVSYGREKPLSSGKTFNSPLTALRGKSVDNLTTLGQNRGSGGTTNSGSSGYYESSSASARHSSTSTLPSSLDQDHRGADDEELFPHPRKTPTTGMFQSASTLATEPPPPPPTFSSRAARAFSFGTNKHSKSPSKDVPPLPPPHANGVHIPSLRDRSPQRERAMTTSSYASTAVPTHSELTLSSSDFGSDDFGNMFESLKKEPVRSPPPAVGSFDRTVNGSTSVPENNPYTKQGSGPMFPPRTLSRDALTPSPNPLKLSRADSSSPYSWDDGNSNDGLVSTSALSSPSLPDGMSGPAAPGGTSQTFLGGSQAGYARLPERHTSPRLASESVEDLSAGFMAAEAKGKEPAYTNRQAQVDDEDRWTRRVELRDAPQSRGVASSGSNSRLNVNTISTPRQTSSRGGPTSPHSSTGDAPDSNTTTPRAARKLGALNEDSMFDVSPAGPASRAIRPGVHRRTESGAAKTMTKAQYQAMVQQGGSSAEQSEENSSDEDYDEEDEIERAKNLATQRRKQEANMSVYRQQMKKVTGGGPTDLPSSGASTVRPSMDRGSSTPGGILHFGGIGGQPPEASIRGRQDEDEDEDVPLGILQAHNFPGSGRPPTRLGENDLQQRRTSVAGSVLNGGAGQGNLPPFARRLPQDPYFGAGLVNPSTRESLALNHSGASVVGMPPSAPPLMGPGAGHPGGLVGVIAGEEKARAARRGSPNTAAIMGGAMPLPSNMMQPNMPRAMSMGNIMPSATYSPSGMPPMPQMNPMMMGGMPGMMPQMPQMPQDASQQQMQQFMAMQMQLMQNMLNMQQAQMTGQMTPTAQPPHLQQTGDYLGVNFDGTNRPQSMASQQGFGPPNQGRSMTMTNPPSGWGSAANPSGPRPSSAMPMTGNGYAPSVHGLNMSHNGPGPGYTPSIAPSERSNIGMPSRYRPVTQNGEASRSQSMTSSMTLQAFAKQQSSTNLPGTPFGSNTLQAPKSTIRVVDKPKGAPKVASRPADEDEDEGWADMKKKREEKKKSKWSFRKEKTTSNEPALSELYQTMD
ncbi:hypothetical protein CB0940_11291 [Cercospora beticola]|uniref:Uncharacterized protein n=1 Tax=Cercospora beticola TaxID=122368 RepID=A0A2G5HDH9_CERBT|nr:hypothetical protein CB0940_11291 [Cercospora beticola]XP_023450140.1 hypothetical protein CB0940_11291 [Cercospora beticola]PIA90578.1 hypothetical protein CB0940_11291 [Cercospora beticola]PIA90579.1 hypothetical protein CB0940_11291 [Cercospora beticola]